MSMFTRDQLYNKGGVMRTKSLFVDMVVDKEHNILTFHDTRKPFPALKPLYISLVTDDPSEAVFADTVFGDITFWTKLREKAFIKKHVAEWEQEANIIRKGKAFKYIIKEIENDGRNGYNAAKFLIDEPWKPKTKSAKATKDQATKAALPSNIADLTKIIRERNAKG